MWSITELSEEWGRFSKRGALAAAVTQLDTPAHPLLVGGERHIPKPSSAIWGGPGMPGHGQPAGQASGTRARPRPLDTCSPGFPSRGDSRPQVCDLSSALPGLPQPWCSDLRAERLSLPLLPLSPFPAGADSTSKFPETLWKREIRPELPAPYHEANLSAISFHFISIFRGCLSIGRSSLRRK